VGVDVAVAVEVGDGVLEGVLVGDGCTATTETLATLLNSSLSLT
jgi:hypothetical protein